MRQRVAERHSSDIAAATARLQSQLRVQYADENREVIHRGGADVSLDIGNIDHQKLASSVGNQGYLVVGSQGKLHLVLKRHNGSAS